MKKLLALLFAVCLLAACFAGCGRKDNDGGEGGSNKLITDKASIDYGFNKLYTDSELADSANNFKTSADITGARFLVNGKYVPTFTDMTFRQDVKMEFYNGSSARMADVSGGMAYTVPATEGLTVDYSIAKYRTQIMLGKSVLTVSSESSNPYAANVDPWGTYRNEWLLYYLMDDGYYEKNGLEKTADPVFEDTTTRPGYDMYSYSVKIKDDSKQIDLPYYNIGVIREANDNINFGFFVMKSDKDRTADMKNILMSYTRITSQGITKNYYDAGTPEANPKWSAETKEYYELLQKDTKVNWGAFSYSMPGGANELEPGTVGYDNFYKDSVEMQQGIENAWGHKYEIYPTYTHISYGSNMHYFPTQMATALAGGNGKNEKPVLQFTYQFTTDNNTVKNNKTTPMFDVLRGKYDDHFEKLAQDIKSYGKPVLFRLNNEMNTDWTSYCGMVTLCDPDIFQMTWKYLYNIFEEEGVDNCIWIWNPIALSCPYSSWGEDLCYNPGAEYVQLLGLTEYQMNNDTDPNKEINSFEKMYSALYKKNAAAWGKYRAIISEFACGSGGNANNTKLGRNAAKQAKWVEEMFNCFNASAKQDFAKQIVGAIWFNCNDEDKTTVTNRLRFFDPKTKAYDDLADTVAAFKKGFAV